MNDDDRGRERFVALATLLGILALGVLYLGLTGYVLHHHH